MTNNQGTKRACFKFASQIKHTGQQSQEMKQTETKNDFDKQGTCYNVNNIFYIHNDEWNSEY